MQKVVLIVVVIFDIFFLHVSLHVIDCPLNAIYQLKEGDFVQFESPNFPQSLVNEAGNHQKECKGSFTRIDGKNGIWFVILNGQLKTFAIDDGDKKIKTFDYYYSNENWLTFYSNSTDLNFYFTSNHASLEWIAFQGFVYATDSSSSSLCPLSNSSTIVLNDETTIIPLTSDLFFDPINWRIKPIKITCDWNFKVPPNFGLKIALIDFYQRYSILKILPADVDLTLPGVYYFNGTNFIIRYIQEDFDVPGTGFAALITAVKLEQLKNGTCKTKIEDGVTVWGNMDTVNGYSNLQTCSYPININPTHEIQLKVTQLLEKDGDKLFLELINGTQINIVNGNWVIDSSFAGANLKFESDGSIVQAGFEVHMQIPECSCNSSTIIVECDVMDQIIFDPGFAGYCRNMNCTYTVSSFHKCPTNDLLLSFFVSLRTGSTDSLRVYSNSTLIKNVNDTTSESEIFDIYFAPSTNITFNFYSDSTFYGFYKAGQIQIKAYSFIYSPGPIYSLNATNFAKSFLIDSIKTFSSLTIQGSPEVDDYLDLFVAPQLDNSDQSYASLDSIRLYDGPGLENFVTALDKLRKNPKVFVPRSIVSQTGSLTLLRLSDDPTFATSFFRLRKEHTAGCKDAENVYSFEEANLTASAGPSGACMITVLSTATIPFSPTNVLNFLNPSNSNQSFEVIAGTDINFSYFDFNSQTSQSWNSVYLFGTSFSFLIPCNQSLGFSYSYTYAQGPKFDDLPAKGIFSSANYADNQAELPLPNITFTIPDNYVMNLQVKHFDFSNIFGCYILQFDEQIPITKAGQFLTLESGEVTVIFNEKEKGHRGALFEFEVVISKYTVPSTSELTTISDASTMTSSESFQTSEFTETTTKITFSSNTFKTSTQSITTAKTSTAKSATTSTLLTTTKSTISPSSTVKTAETTYSNFFTQSTSEQTTKEITTTIVTSPSATQTQSPNSCTIYEFHLIYIFLIFVFYF